MNKQEFDAVRGLIAFLERFLPEVKNKKNEEAYEFKNQDKEIWDAYFNKLILSDVLTDGKAYDKSNDSNLGIGKDGIFVPAEYYQLLMQCYKYLYEALSCGDIFMKHTGWYVEEHT